MVESIQQRLLQADRRHLVPILAGLLLLLVLLFLPQENAGQEATGLAAQSFLVLAVLAFGAGIFSFVSPCTLPILPAYFAFATQSGRSRIALNTVAFMLGVATMFSLLGASASAVGRLFIQNQDLLLLVGGAIIMAFGVMSLLGKGFAGFSSETSSAPETTARGSFAFGLTFSVGWSSCVGPILGAVLTLAASTGSVTRGIVLLFIYAMGLGLPLIIVSTFFGRASRKSLFWRLLKGKGWQVNTRAIVVHVIWALAIWRVLVALARYAYDNLAVLEGRSLVTVQEIGFLIVTLSLAVLWNLYKERDGVTLDLHSTQLVSGVLFIFMALLMLSGALADFNSLVPPDLALWFIDLEERLIAVFA